MRQPTANGGMLGDCIPLSTRPPLSDPHHEEELVGSVKAIAARTTQSSSDLSSGLPHLAL